MRTNLVYDLPTRIFHWLFAGLFLTSFIIAKSVDDESPTYSYHMLSGILLGGLVLWRLIWGLFGSKYSRFTGFNLNLTDLKDYLWGIASGSKKRWLGHNPASSWAAITMFSLALGLAVTGYMMSTGSKESFEDLHEFLANTFIIVVVLHIAGIIIHSLRHRDAIAFSMVDGKKVASTPETAIESSRPLAAVVLIALIIAGGLLLAKNFDPANQTLQFFGNTLQLGENEGNNKELGATENEESGNTSKSDDQDKDDD